MRTHVEVGQVGEGRGVSRDDRPAGRSCCRRDQQVVRSAWCALAAHLHEQTSVSLGNCDVVGDHRDRCEDILDERLPRSGSPSRSEQRADPQLSDGDRCDRDIVLVSDHLVQGAAGTVGVDEKRRVEQQPRQDRTSTSTNRRREESSSDQLASGWCRRSKAFASAPSPGLAGSRCAMGFPRLTTVKCSPRCSTASRMSAKLRAASVALTSGTKIRLSDVLKDVADVVLRRLAERAAGLCPQIEPPHVCLRSETRSEVDPGVVEARGGPPPASWSADRWRPSGCDPPCLACLLHWSLDVRFA